MFAVRSSKAVARGAAPLGERHLKDIDEPERVYELEIEGVEPTPAPDAGVPRPAATTRKRRPTPKSREEEWEEDFENRVEDFVKRTTERALQWTSGKFSRLASSEPDDTDSGGVNEIAARADELGKRCKMQNPYVHRFAVEVSIALSIG